MARAKFKSYLPPFSGVKAEKGNCRGSAAILLAGGKVDTDMTGVQTSSPAMPRVAVVIPAAGSGKRMGLVENKVLLPLGGEPGLRHLVRLFSTIPGVSRIAVMVQSGQRPAISQALAGLAPDTLHLMEGGAERQDSVRKGLEHLAADPPDWVLVHDGARPLATRGLVDRVLTALHEHPSVVPALPITDTVRRRSGSHTEVVPREGLYQVQTPQGFHWGPLWNAHDTARREGFMGTDDAQLLEHSGIPAHLVPGEFSNLKLTVAKDILLAEVFFRLTND